MPPADVDPVMPEDDEGLEDESSNGPASQELLMPEDDAGLQDEETCVGFKRRKVTKYKPREEGPARQQLMHSIHHIALRDRVL